MTILLMRTRAIRLETDFGRQNHPSGSGNKNSPRHLNRLPSKQWGTRQMLRLSCDTCNRNIVSEMCTSLRGIRCSNAPEHYGDKTISGLPTGATPAPYTLHTNCVTTMLQIKPQMPARRMNSKEKEKTNRESYEKRK